MQNIYHAPYLNIYRADFHSILLAEARRVGVVLKLGRIVTNIDFLGPAVQTSDGEVHRADLVLGADGENSICREALLGRSNPPLHSGDIIFCLTVRADEIRRHDNVREFVELRNINAWFGPDAHTVVFSLKKADVFHIIGSY